MLRRRTVLAGLAASAATPVFAHHWKMPEEWAPVVVRLKNEIPPGEIHVDPNTFSLYYTMEKRQALRYRVGVGRGNLYEPGTFWINAKRKWPSWRPTDEMIEREPEKYEQYIDGMPGGPSNPLGARALYLFTESGRDTYLRIHGTPQPWTVGSAVSNGCVRLVNEHIEALYEQIPLDTKAVLYPKRPKTAATG